MSEQTDWERDTGQPWPVIPLDRSYYSTHHYRDGWLVVGKEGPWRLRDRFARVVNYHCWECWRSYR